MSHVSRIVGLRDAGVVHEHVEPAEPSTAVGDRMLRRRAGVEMSADDQLGLGPARVDERDGLGAAVLVEVDDDDPRTLRGEPHRGGAAEAGRRCR